MELEQKTFEDSKNRILAEFSGEKDRLLKEIHQKEHELELQREKFHKDKKELVEQMNREFSEKIRMIEKRNQVNSKIINSILLSHNVLYSSMGHKELIINLNKNKNIEEYLACFVF